MECIRCSGEMLETTTIFAKQLGNAIVVVTNVPCFKCKECGEISYTMAVVKRLEEITKQLEQVLAGVAVVDYTAA